MLDRDETKPVRTAITGAPSEPAIRWGPRNGGLCPFGITTTI